MIKYIEIPKNCPFCGAPLEIKQEYESKVLYCTNINCSSRFINYLDHIFGTKGLDIKGISQATLQKLIDWGWVKEPQDIFHLNQYAKEWINKDGFGTKSVERILDSISEGSKNVELWRVLAAAGIPNVGTSTAKMLANRFLTYSDFRTAVSTNFDFTNLQDIGDATAHFIKQFNYADIDKVVANLTIKNSNNQETNPKLTKTFVITGKLKNGNRNWLKNKIEQAGGKVTDSISSKTDYLINNDINSVSSKNIKAKQLNIPIITEDETLEMLKNDS